MSSPVYRCCGDCKHFEQSRFSKMGMGSCMIGGEGTKAWVTDRFNKDGAHVVYTHHQKPLWPNARRYCSDFEAIPT